MHCVLDEAKTCDHCGACDRCDLDPNKICDNCCKCLDERPNAEYAVIPVSDVVMERTQEYLEEYYREENEAGNKDQE